MDKYANIANRRGVDHKIKILILAALSVGSCLLVMLLKPISQSLAYHRFADTRQAFGVPNFANVISNLPFLFVSLYGLIQFQKARSKTGLAMAYWVMVVGILCTAFGSAFYHWNPNNDTLVFDRIPMTLVFMSLLSIMVSDFINNKLGKWLLWPLVLCGVASVLWWHYTEQEGKGDLRWYGLVQFYPMLFIPLIFVLFYKPNQRSRLVLLAWAVAWYMIAKVLELLDHQLYDLMRISGHTLKHVAAAVSTWFLVLTYNPEKQPRHKGYPA